jgi:hypothetical protein
MPPCTTNVTPSLQQVCKNTIFEKKKKKTVHQLTRKLSLHFKCEPEWWLEFLVLDDGQFWFGFDLY